MVFYLSIFFCKMILNYRGGVFLNFPNNPKLKTPCKKEKPHLKQLNTCKVRLKAFIGSTVHFEAEPKP